MNNDLLSIIIPCYNNWTFLKEMITCFQRQTSSNWELIIVDDGSTDDTFTQIQEASNSDNRIHAYQRNRHPKGSVVCRNIGFQKAKGKYICHLDADDLVSDTFVEHRVSFMEQNPDIDYASFVAKQFINSNNLPDYNADVNTWGKEIKGADILHQLLTTKYPFAVWCNIYRKSSISTIPWDEKVKIYTDFSFMVPCVLIGLKHKYANLNEVDYFYRCSEANSGAMTKNFVSDEKCESTIYLFRKTIDLLNEYDLDHKYKKSYLSFAFVHLYKLIKGNSVQNTREFINLCKDLFGYRWRFQIIELISNTKNQKIRTGLYFAVIGFLFGKKDYIKILSKTLLG